MKESKCIGLAWTFFLIVCSIFSQTPIVNPEKPLNKNAGRVLKLKEVFRIRDEGANFYFKYPRKLKVATDGSFFVVDENQFLKFSPQGQFVRNLFKAGQGPGEIPSREYKWAYISYCLTKDGIYLTTLSLQKIIHTDMNGNLIDEIKLNRRLSELHWIVEDKFIFIEQEPIYAGSAKEARFRDIEMSVIVISDDGFSESKILSFPKKIFESPKFGMDWAPFDAVFDSARQELFVSHTCEYKIVQADLQKGRVIKSFLRKYPRVNHVLTKREKENIKRFNAPKRKYKNDTIGLFLHQDHLWILTSTRDKNKGQLIDVFDRQGRFVDNFYLNYRGSLAAVENHSLFIMERDKDDILQIVKYKIME
ncbi:MAG: hypothetical protein KAU46_02750 [Candidatus Aminicenantes bacterium]|nr:hypothetical protein [Candidatus Aminicenantes bacterium]